MYEGVVSNETFITVLYTHPYWQSTLQLPPTVDTRVGSFWKYLQMLLASDDHGDMY